MNVTGSTVSAALADLVKQHRVGAEAVPEQHAAAVHQRVREQRGHPLSRGDGHSTRWLGRSSDPCSCGWVVWPTNVAWRNANGARSPLIPRRSAFIRYCLLHAYVFLEGTEPEVLNAAAGEEAMNYLATYLQRLRGDDLRRIREDMVTLAAFAKSEKWPKQQVRFLQDFLKENGITQ